MNVNKNSWHYKWYAFTKVTSSIIGDNFHAIKSRREQGISWVKIHDSLFHAPLNFCQYWRAVLIYPVVAALINLTILAVILAGAIFNPINALWFLLSIVAFILVLFGIAILAVGSDIAAKKAKELTRNDDNLVGNIYKSYKNNICTKVNYED